jgi:hypothetical protein
LADPSPCLRWLVLTHLLGRSEDDAEVAELAAARESDPLALSLLAGQGDDGAWHTGSLPASWGDDPVRITGYALARLGFLGFGPDFPPVRRGAEYLFTEQRQDGSWPLWSGRLDGAPLQLGAEPGARHATRRASTPNDDENEGYSMIPLQTAFPLRGLAACGFATDPRAERAYEWLLAQRLPDGAWPTGIAAGTLGRVGGYRRLAHSRWGCRSNTTGAWLCLALHPQRRQSQEARRGLDLLLGRETREAHVFGFEISRLLGAEPARGRLTFFARFDQSLVLALCAAAGLSTDDERVSSLVAFVQSLQGPYGLWEYPPQPQTARWVTYDVLRSLRQIASGTEWFSLEPRTPFRAYPPRSL